MFEAHDGEDVRPRLPVEHVVHGADGDAAPVGDGPDGELLAVHHGPQVQGEALGTGDERVVGAGVREVAGVRDRLPRRLSAFGQDPTTGGSEGQCREGPHVVARLRVAGDSADSVVGVAGERLQRLRRVLWMRCREPTAPCVVAA